jgi:hypothetical protein
MTFHTGNGESKFVARSNASKREKPEIEGDAWLRAIRKFNRAEPECRLV